MTAAALADTAEPRPSAFAGVDICREAGLTLRAGTKGPTFEDDLWDFTEVVGLPVQMGASARRLDFTPIAESRWRLAAKELILALLAPRHDAVASLPRALRAPPRLRSCHARLAELTRWLSWLANQGVDSLSTVRAEHCLAYLENRSHLRDGDGRVIGDLGPAATPPKR
jgi:hypothetical protein